MNEYDVKRRLAGAEKVNNESAPQMTNGIPNSVLADVFAGKQRASSEMMGHRSNLAPSIAAKMSQSFGMDVSGVQVYRSDAMAGSTMHGMAQDNKVVLSSDVDLNTLEGQAVLGHELSHIRAQSMGIGTGSGLLSDTGLEHQADTEGMLAARGMTIGGESMGMSMGLGMAGLEGLQPIGAGMGASAAAPMQANKDDDKYNNLMNKKMLSPLSEEEQATLSSLTEKRNNKAGGKAEETYADVINSANLRDVNDKDDLTYKEWSKKVSARGKSGGAAFLKDSVLLKNGKSMDTIVSDSDDDGDNAAPENSEAGEKYNRVSKRLSDAGIKLTGNFGGASPVRLLTELCGKDYQHISEDEIFNIFQDFYSGDEERKKKAHLALKEIRMHDMEDLEQKYGTLPTQMHFQDFLQKAGMKSFAGEVQKGQQIQDVNQGENNMYNVEFGDTEKEKRYNALKNYYGTAFAFLMGLFAEIESDNPDNIPLFKSNGDDNNDAENVITVDQDFKNCVSLMKESETYIHGKHMDEKQLAEYNKYIKKRVKNNELLNLPTVD